MGTDAKVVVRLSIEERLQLEVMLNEPRLARDRGLRIRMLLKADADGPAWAGSKIAEAFDVSVNTVARLRHRCVFEGLEAATSRRPPRGTKPRNHETTEARRCGGGSAGGSHLQRGSRRIREMDYADAGRPARRAEDRR